jgi:hypothetical protein
VTDSSSNKQLARELQPELERAGWTLSLGSIAAVLDALNFHQRASETGMCESLKVAARYHQNCQTCVCKDSAQRVDSQETGD